MEFRIKDPTLAKEGKNRIDWAEAHMPVLVALRQKYEKTKPLKGTRVAGCLHVTKETGVLVRTLKAAGAELSWCGCNPLSTQDDVAASLAQDEGISIFASRGVTQQEYYDDIHSAMMIEPHVTIDDGADLTVEMHKKNFNSIRGGTEETTTGVIRLRAMQKAGKLMYPIIAVNDAETKHDFDNIYGTGQSALDGIIRATNILFAGRTVVVCGYGMCGRGVASRAKGMGADVVVTEVDATRALEAAMDGYRVLPGSEAATQGDVFVTVTGNKHVLRGEHFELMKDGAILANAGHFDIEIDLFSLRTMATNVRRVRPEVEEFSLAGDRKIYVLSEGRLVNLAAAEGHPASVMDMSFANQALSCEWLSGTASELEKKVYEVPDEIDKQ